MYEYILDSKLLTGVIAVGLAILASAIAGGRGLAWRLLLFNISSLLACAFFAAALFAPEHISLIDVVSGLAFELVVLLLYTAIFAALVRQVRRTPSAEAMKALWITLGVHVILAWPLLSSAGFGLFSEGSRIEYLYADSAAKYLTYGGFMLSALQAGLLAQRISNSGKLGWPGYGVVAVNFSMSLLSGSKGAFFLWLASVFALVDYRTVRMRPAVVAGVLAMIVVSLAVVANVVGNFTGVTVPEFMELAFSRFFLSNDARAMAFDLHSLSEPTASLFAESFRSIATLVGNPPIYPPLGVHFYEKYFGSSDGNGANASLAALFMYFSQAGYAAVPAILFSIGAIGLFSTILMLHRSLGSQLNKLAVLTWGAMALYTYTQDFLAFQVVLPLMIVALAFMAVFDTPHTRAASHGFRAQPSASS